MATWHGGRTDVTSTRPGRTAVNQPPVFPHGQGGLAVGSWLLGMRQFLVPFGLDRSHRGDRRIRGVRADRSRLFVIFDPGLPGWSGHRLRRDCSGNVTVRRETLELPERRCRMPAVRPVVRAAAPADAEQVAAIFAHYVATSVATFEEVAPTAADWRRRLGDLAGRNLPFLVAEADGDGPVCGFAYASPWRPKPAYRHTVEDTVYLSPGHTGRGLGSALLGGLLAGCAAAGARQVIAVIADTGSDASAALHRRFGFTQAGVLAGVGRKHGRWIDTVLMQKDLGSGE
jgi:L-amino acid N-acyltransferase YncA